jgi:hypothetical protein
VLQRLRAAVPAVLLGLSALAPSLVSSGAADLGETGAGGVPQVSARPAAVLPVAARPAGARPVVARPVAMALPRRLSWAPPALTAPVSIAVGNSSATLALDNRRDYVLHLPAARPAVRPAGLVISGGHNVVLVGGSVDVAGGIRTWNGKVQRRAMYLKGQTGTVFIEGVSFLSSTTGGLTEGINLDQRLGATVVLQNIRLGRLVGSRATNHADGLQTWAGPRRLLIDGLSMQTQYQGMFLLPNQHFKKGPAPELFDLRNISIVGEPGSGYLLWRDRQDFPWRLENVNVRPGSRKLTARRLFLWDPLGTFASVRAVDVVPPAALSSGVAYRSPGYEGRL